MSDYPNDKTNKIRYILYLSKSTEDEEKQVLSRDGQKDKCNEQFKNLNIIDNLDESKSAFEPVRREDFKNI